MSLGSYLFICDMMVVIFWRGGAILKYVARAAAAGTVTAFVSHGLKWNISYVGIKVETFSYCGVGTNLSFRKNQLFIKWTTCNVIVYILTVSMSTKTLTMSTDRIELYLADFGERHAVEWQPSRRHRFFLDVVNRWRGWFLFRRRHLVLRRRGCREGWPHPEIVLGFVLFDFDESRSCWCSSSLLVRLSSFFFRFQSHASEMKLPLNVA